MPKLQAFEVVLEGDNVDVFRPGEWITGYVRILLAATKKDIRGIFIKFQGKAKTRWHESQGSGSSRSTVTYTSKELYFNEALLIFGGDKAGTKLELEPGDHRFPFRFYIPDAPLPIPFESKFGYIRYKIKATIDRPWRFNHDTKRLFSIQGVDLDLNRMRPTVGMPHKAENIKNTCCLCCESRPINMTVQINKAGFVPGELVWVDASVDNQTRREILSIRAKLKHRVIVTGRRHGMGDYECTKDWTELLAYVEWGGCGGHSSVVDRKPLRIPPCPASALLGCNIIKVEYFLEFAANVAGTPFDLRLILPIIIGTIPLRSAYTVSPTSRGVITQQPSASSPVPPPPSYEIAVGGLHEIPSKSGYDYTFGKLMYAPRYPFYNLPIHFGARSYPSRSSHGMRDSPHGQGESRLPPMKEIEEDLCVQGGTPPVMPTQRMVDFPHGQDSPPTPPKRMLDSPAAQGGLPPTRSPRPNSLYGVAPKTLKQLDSPYSQGESPQTMSTQPNSPLTQDGVPVTTSAQPISPYTQSGSSPSTFTQLTSLYGQDGSPLVTTTQGMGPHYRSGIQNEPQKESIEPRNIVVSLEHNTDASHS